MEGGCLGDRVSLIPFLFGCIFNSNSFFRQAAETEETATLV